MRRSILLFPFVLLAIVALAAPAARAADCEQTLAAKFAKFTRARTKLMQHCRELVLLGRAPGPCPDYRTTAQIEKARGKLRQAVNEACGGDDKSCGAGGDDVDLATIGWNVPQCPDFQGSGCTNAIGHCDDVADCLVCTGEAAVDTGIALVYDALDPSPALSEVGRCQKSLGRSVARYFDAKTSALAACEHHDLGGPATGACPDPIKTAPRILRAAEKLVNRICNACGSNDDICGGDDILPAWIGFPATCPAVTPPGGSSCAQPITQLIDLIECVRCVTDFQVGCLDPLAVPRLKSYPSACP